MKKYKKPVVLITTHKGCDEQRCVARSGMGMCKITFVKK
jgi:hypothetical protein